MIRYSNMYVDVLWVHKEKRGGGLGAALLSRIIEERVVKGLSDLFLDTFTFQAPAFYEKFGFIEVGRFRNHPKKALIKFFTKEN